MKDEEARREVAAKIADALGETGERPRAQIARIVALMGAEWTQEVLRESREWAVNPTAIMNTTKSGKRRMFGGLFFAVARARASGDVLSGTITRREFFQAFTDRPPKPRALSWIDLEVTEVRVERLQDITEEDAKAEGVDHVSIADVPRQAAWSCRQDFSVLWDKINGGKAPWKSNPWVWVVSFKRVRP